MKPSMVDTQRPLNRADFCLCVCFYALLFQIPVLMPSARITRTVRILTENVIVERDGKQKMMNVLWIPCVMV